MAIRTWVAGRHIHVSGTPYNDAEAKAQSIEKWSLILETAIQTGQSIECGWASTCGFCLLHTNENDTIVCRECPIGIQTGETGCHGTPFYRAARLEGVDMTADNKEWPVYLEAVRDELEFLKGVNIEEEDNQNETWNIYAPDENSTYRLPTVIEIFYLDGPDAGDSEKEDQGPGWYVGNGSPGCLYDNTSGPYNTKKDALEWAPTRSRTRSRTPSTNSFHVERK